MAPQAAYSVPVFAPFFHAWERRLAAVSTERRVVRPFDWGLDWLPPNGTHGALSNEARLDAYVSTILSNSDEYFTPEPTSDYELTPANGEEPAWLRFPTSRSTPHPENNIVHARYFPGEPRRSRMRRAVLVMPQWNSDLRGHVGLSKLLARYGLSALRLSLPYHDRRMPPELRRADYIVSSNVGRTLEVCRQAVHDARRAVWWLEQQGYERIGILGTSLGSCLAMLTAAHEPRIKVQALNHVSPYFADVVWRGLSTEHVREGLEGAIDLQRLRRLWMPISPFQYLERIRDLRTLLVYARYDLTFPVDLSREIIAELRRRKIPHMVRVLPCGHYTTGSAPFKYLDGYILTKFLLKNL